MRVMEQDKSLGSWRELAVFSAYRLFLATTLFTVFYLRLPPDFLGSSKPELFQLVASIYVLVALLFLLAIVIKRGQVYSHALFQLLTDIVFLTLLIDASGGLSTGLGLLLVVVIVAGGALIPGRLAVFIAAVATLAILLEVGYSNIIEDGITKYSHAGMLGATFFATALFSHLLTRKMKTTQNLADQHERDARKLAALNQHIINRMLTGILVIDDAGRVAMSNEAARQMLGIAHTRNRFSLNYLVPDLAEQYKKWQHKTLIKFEPIQVRPELPQVLPRFTHLDSGETLIYIDNTSELARQAQQMKLASLGQLTASIAHEIRNPLGAISYAGELLAETHEQDATIQKLTAIIQRHSSRMNTIIDTILNMTRRKETKQQVVILALWLSQLIKEFCEVNRIASKEIRLIVKSALAKVRMDEEQLQQVITNLLDNAWYYSVPDTDTERVTVTIFTQDDRVMIEIKDNGKGVSEKMRPHLFEPFQSDKQEGTGLGLYLSRELCEANGAELNYIEQEQGCCFRVSFPIEWQETLL